MRGAWRCRDFRLLPGETRRALSNWQWHPGYALFLLGVIKLPSIERPAKLGFVRLSFAAASLAVACWFVTRLGGKSLGVLEAFMPPTDSGWIKDYARALQVARATNRPILINFTGVTCTNCRMMEKNVFPQPTVRKQLSKYVTVELYTDREISSDAQNKALQQQLTGVITLPEYVRLDPDGHKLGVFQGSTYDVQRFADWLKGQIAAGVSLKARHLLHELSEVRPGIPRTGCGFGVVLDAGRIHFATEIPFYGFVV